VVFGFLAGFVGGFRAFSGAAPVVVGFLAGFVGFLGHSSGFCAKGWVI
jgi:hypothetical protein